MSTEGRIQPGFYKGRAVAGSEQYGLNAKNGNEQIAIDVAVPSLNRTFTTFLHFTDAAAPYAIERLRACGWEGTDLSRLSDLDKNEIDVSVKYEIYEGKERMKVDIATGGGRVKLENQMDDRQKRAFAARMQGLLKGTGNASAPPARERKAAPPPAGGGGGGTDRNGYPSREPDDEIPFITASTVQPRHLRRRSLWERF